MRQREKWIGIVIVTVLLVAGSFTGANEGIAKAQIAGKANAAEIRENTKALRAEAQTLQLDIKKQAVQIRQLSRQVELLNSQVQKQLNQVQKNKIKLSDQEVMALREHLQMVKASSQRLAEGEQRAKTAQQQWKQQGGAPSTAMVKALKLVKTAQAQKVYELMVLQNELQQITKLLAVKQ